MITDDDIDIISYNNSELLFTAYVVKLAKSG